MTNHVPEWARGQFSIESTIIEDVSVPYLVGGEGPALIMIHGLSASFDWWQRNAPDLARHFRVYLFDLPGFGRLSRLRREASMDSYANWILEFMDAIQLQKAHLLGISMSGDIVMRIAVKQPERVGKLVLVTPTSVQQGDSIISWGITGLRVLTEVPLELIPLAITDGIKVGPITFWRSSTDMISGDTQELLSVVKAETLILASNNDSVLPPSFFETYLNEIPHARLTVFPGAGHLIMLSRPQLFNQKVAEFLREPSPV